MKKFVVLVLVSLAVFCRAQCPTVTVPPVVTLTNCQYGQTVAAISNYSANIQSAWYASGPIKIGSTGTSTSIAYVNTIDTYTVIFTDVSSNCSTTKTISVTNGVNNKPAMQITA